MIALITSTLIPTSIYSAFTPDERLTQTINTIHKLRDAGFSDIFFLDNSIDEINSHELIKAYDLIKIFRTPQYTFESKGLNEALLILNNIHHLPSNTPIFKISGRYYPTSSFSKDIYNLYSEKDFVGVAARWEKKISDFSTRAYFVKNTEVLASTLVQAIEDMLSYCKGIHGIRSGMDAMREIFKPYIGTQYVLSIEQSFARILKEKKNFILLDKLNIEGYIAGSKFNAFVQE